MSVVVSWPLFGKDYTQHLSPRLLYLLRSMHLPNITKAGTSTTCNVVTWHILMSVTILAAIVVVFMICLWSIKALGTPPLSSTLRLIPITRVVTGLITLMATAESYTTHVERSKDRCDCIAAQALQRRVEHTPEKEELKFSSQVVDQELGRVTTRSKDDHRHNYLVKDN